MSPRDHSNDWPPITLRPSPRNTTKIEFPVLRRASERRPGARRKTGNSIFVVFRGEGRSVISGQSFGWSRGDMFVVPSWYPVDHEAATGGDLFEVSDEAALRALALFREERLGPQPVTSEFEPRSLDSEVP